MFSSGIEGKGSLYLVRFCEVNEYYAGLILESKGMRAIFQKRAKKGKIFENFGKNVQNLKIF